MKPCDGKQRFPSYSMAASLARRSRRRQGTNRGAYRCHDCGGWHTGSRVGRQMRRPRYEEVVA